MRTAQRCRHSLRSLLCLVVLGAVSAGAPAQEVGAVPAADFRAAQALLWSGEYAEAEAAFDTLVNEFPNNVAIRLNRAICRRQAGHIKPSLEDCDFILAGNPTHLAAGLNRSLALADNGEFDAADKQLTDLLATAPRAQGVIHTTRGVIRLQQSEFEDAIADFKAALEFDPLQKPAKAYLKVAYVEEILKTETNQETLTNVARELSELLEDFPKFPLLHKTRGRLHLARNEDASAIEDFTTYLKHCPSDLEIRTARGDAYNRKGDLREAIADWSMVLNTDDNRHQLRRSRALAFFNLRHYAGTLTDVCRLSEDEECTSLTAAVGVLAAVALDQDLVPAGKFLEPFLTDDSTEATPLVVRSILLLRQKLPHQAAKDLLRVKELIAGDEDVRTEWERPVASLVACCRLSLPATDDEAKELDGWLDALCVEQNEWYERVRAIARGGAVDPMLLQLAAGESRQGEAAFLQALALSVRNPRAAIPYYVESVRGGSGCDTFVATFSHGAIAAMVRETGLQAKFDAPLEVDTSGDGAWTQFTAQGPPAPRGAAARLGLRKGDVIAEVGGHVVTASTFWGELLCDQIDRNLGFEVLRNDELATLTLEGWVEVDFEIAGEMGTD